MSFLGATFKPIVSSTASVETQAYAVATVTGVAPRTGRREEKTRALQTAASGRRDPSATVPVQTERGRIRDIIV